MKSRKRMLWPPRQGVRPANANGESDSNIDPIEAGEQELDYDPERDFTTEPLLPTGNRYGYALILLGGLFVLLTLSGITASRLQWFFAILLLVVPLLMILMGVRLVKGNSDDLK